MNFDAQEREAYEEHLKWLRIESSALKKAEDKGLAIGIEQGFVIGREEGLVKGREEGIVKGREEGIIDVAKALIHAGLDLATISKTTGLKVDYLKSLVDGLRNQRN